MRLTEKLLLETVTLALNAEPYSRRVECRPVPLVGDGILEITVYHSELPIGIVITGFERVRREARAISDVKLNIWVVSDYERLHVWKQSLSWREFRGIELYKEFVEMMIEEIKSFGDRIRPFHLVSSGTLTDQLVRLALRKRGAS